MRKCRLILIGAGSASFTIRLVAQALFFDRCVTSRSAAERLADELLLAHRDHLPQFA